MDVDEDGDEEVMMMGRRRRMIIIVIMNGTMSMRVLMICYIYYSQPHNS